MSIKKIGPLLTEAVHNPGKASARPNPEEKIGSNGGTSSDRVDLSQNYRNLAEATKAVSAYGDIRTDKVQQVKDQLDSGNYQIKPSDIASRMLEEVI